MLSLPLSIHLASLANLSPAPPPPSPAVGKEARFGRDPRESGVTTTLSQCTFEPRVRTGDSTRAAFRAGRGRES